MKLWTMLLAVSVALSMTVAGDAQVMTVPIAPSLVDPATQLVGFTAVPIYLPAVLPSRSDLYAHVVVVQHSSYVVEVDFDPGCDNHRCQFGEIAGYAPNDPDYPPLVGTPKKLDDGTAVLFSSQSCGNRCEDVALVFDRNGYRYLVEAQSATLDIVMQVANSLQGPLPNKR